MNKEDIKILNAPILALNESIIFQVTLPSGAIMTRPFSTPEEPEMVKREFIITEQGKVILLSV